MPSSENILAQAKSLHQGGRLAEAERCYRQIVDAGEATAEACYLHGVCCQALGRGDDALRSLRQAVAIEPDHAQALHYLGVLLAQQGQADQAVALLERAQRLTPMPPKSSRVCGTRAQRAKPPEQMPWSSRDS